MAWVTSCHVMAQMKTAAGQCCFYAVPERDAQGIGRHYAVRTHETLCDGWLVLHKARPAAPIALPRTRRLDLYASTDFAAEGSVQQPHAPRASWHTARGAPRAYNGIQLAAAALARVSTATSVARRWSAANRCGTCTTACRAARRSGSCCAVRRRWRPPGSRTTRLRCRCAPCRSVKS